MLAYHDFSICFGETPAGNDFEQSCINFDTNVVEPFEAFLRNVFSESFLLTCCPI